MFFSYNKWLMVDVLSFLASMGVILLFGVKSFRPNFDQIGTKKTAMALDVGCSWPLKRWMLRCGCVKRTLCPRAISRAGKSFKMVKRRWRIRHKFVFLQMPTVFAFG